MKKITHYRSILWVVICFCLTLVSFAQDTDKDAIKDAVIAASTPEIIQSSLSPDEAFTAQVTVYPCTLIDEQEVSYERLDLIDNTTDEAHLIAEQFINCGGLGAYGLSVMRWSLNGNFLYYTDAREGTPDGFAIAWSAPVYRMNVSEMETESLGQAQFSPDGEQVVTWNQEQVTILQSDSDESTDFSLVPEDMQITQVVWLPDNNGLLYIQTDNPFQSTTSAVTHIDLGIMEQTVILDN